MANPKPPKEEPDTKEKSPKYSWKPEVIWKLIDTLEMDANRKVLFGKRSDENTSGERKAVTFSRIGQHLFKDELALVDPLKPAELTKKIKSLGGRVKTKYEGLIKTYKKHAARMMATRGGLEQAGDDIEEMQAGLDRAKDNNLYTPPGGPVDGETTEAAKNLWDAINHEWEYFARVHALVGCRPSVVPIEIHTAIGPNGATTIHPQPPSPPPVEASNRPDNFEVTFVDPLLRRRFNSDPNLSSTSEQSVPRPSSNQLELIEKEKVRRLIGQSSSKAEDSEKVGKGKRKGLLKTKQSGKTPARLSSTTSTAAKSCGTSTAGRKKGLEDVLASMQSTNQEMMKRKFEADILKDKQAMLLQEYDRGLITKEEYRQSLQYGEPATKKRRCKAASSRSISASEHDSLRGSDITDSSSSGTPLCDWEDSDSNGGTAEVMEEAQSEVMD